MKNLLETERDHRAHLVTLMCCMDERDRVQKKTFTKWINQHLLKVRKHINDLYEDLRDGHNLITLLEVLSGDTLPRERGRMRFHKLQNVQIALDYLKRRQVRFWSYLFFRLLSYFEIKEFEGKKIPFGQCWNMM
uniref:Si:ch211-165e15.1 n=1 Tax=Cyprinodon variegatus TaxID=28743 RepID=A0A3Q2GPS1_CYPVA